MKSKRSIIVCTTQWCDPQQPQCDDRNLENYILYHFPRIRDTSFNHEWNFWVFMSLIVTYGHVAQWGDLYFLTFFFIFHQVKDIWAMPLIFLQIQVTAAFECRGDIELNAFPTSYVNLRRGLEHLWSFQKQHPGINKIKCFQLFLINRKFVASGLTGCCLWKSIHWGWPLMRGLSSSNMVRMKLTMQRCGCPCVIPDHVKTLCVCVHVCVSVCTCVCGCLCACVQSEVRLQI